MDLAKRSFPQKLSLESSGGRYLFLDSCDGSFGKIHYGARMQHDGSFGKIHYGARMQHDGSFGKIHYGARMQHDGSLARSTTARVDSVTDL